MGKVAGQALVNATPGQELHPLWDRRYLFTRLETILPATPIRLRCAGIASVSRTEIKKIPGSALAASSPSSSLLVARNRGASGRFRSSVGNHLRPANTQRRDDRCRGVDEGQGATLILVSCGAGGGQRELQKGK